MSPFYAFLKLFIRLTLKVYFSKIEIVGIKNLSADSPLIITPNHQNAFLDALIIGSFSPIPIHFITRSDVFTWWSRPLLHAMNMMPIYRIRDGYSTLSQNDAVFEACRGLFKQKKSILIFAEGNHGEHHYLRPLTKGAARLALQSQLAMEEDLKIVPIGLNYFRHTLPKSKVSMIVGSPISVKEYVAAYQQNSGTGLINMRNAISLGMKSTLVIPEPVENYEEHRQAIFRKENEGLSFKELKNITVSSTSFQQIAPSKHRLSKILNPLPFLIIWKVLSGIKDIVFYSSLKFGIGLIVFPLWWIGSFFTGQWLLGTIPSLVIVCTMIGGLFFDYRRNE